MNVPLVRMKPVNRTRARTRTHVNVNAALVLPAFAAVSLHQKSSFFLLCTECIVFKLAAQLLVSTSDCILQTILSAALALRRAAQQSASNQGVVGLFLWCSLMNGQCLSSRSVITCLYRSTGSSADTLARPVRSPSHHLTADTVLYWRPTECLLSASPAAVKTEQAHGQRNCIAYTSSYQCSNNKTERVQSHTS